MMQSMDMPTWLLGRSSARNIPESSWKSDLSQAFAPSMALTWNQENHDKDEVSNWELGRCSLAGFQTGLKDSGAPSCLLFLLLSNTSSFTRLTQRYYHELNKGGDNCRFVVSME
jgi:hypothetical protein